MALFGRRGSSGITKTRSFLYMWAKVLGDVQAVQKGHVRARVGRRIVGKETGKAIGGAFRKFY
jgi:hypothetical protein